MAGRTVPPPEANIGIRLFDRLRPLIGLGEMPVIVADEIQRQIDALPDEQAARAIGSALNALWLRWQMPEVADGTAA